MSTDPHRPPRTFFLDAGNTLLTIDWRLVADELAELGFEAEPSALARAEAAARPALSRWITGRSTETLDTFEVYAGLILERLPPAGAGSGRGAPLGRERRTELARGLTARVKRPGRADHLWNRPLRGAREALEHLAARGVGRVVVSNSDGSVARSLERAGLADLIEHVVDSHLVGAEKPDPAIFEHALRLSGAERGATVHVGDMYGADVVGARAAGLRAVLLDPHGDWGPMDCPTAPDLLSLVREALPGG